MYAPQKHKVTAGAKYIVLLMSFLLIIPAVMAFFTDHSERSRWENRELNTFPDIKQISRGAEYFREIDDYLNDHFGLAIDMNKLQRKLVFYLYKDSPAPNISIGKNGFIFLTGPTKNNPFSSLRKLCINSIEPEYITDAIKTWHEILSFYVNTFEEVTMIIVPSKPVLYPEYLPLNIPHYIRTSCAEYGKMNNAATELSHTVMKKKLEGHLSIQTVS